MISDELVLGNADVAVTVAPHIGGRVVRLEDPRRGVQWLVPGRERRRDPVAAGARWESFERAGWDECFPNIAAGQLRNAGQVADLADHGDLWSRPWHVAADGDQLTLVAGGDLPYTFTRTISLDGPRVLLDYEVTVERDDSLPFLWAMHPLLRGDCDIRRLVPTGTEVTVEYASVPWLAAGDRIRWGEPVGRAGDWVLGERPRVPVAAKLFTAAGGVASATVTCGDAALRYELDPRVLPYVGIWLNYGAWPPGEAGDEHIAVEPATADTDHLPTALTSGTATVLARGGRRGWRVVLTVGPAD